MRKNADDADVKAIVEFDFALMVLASAIRAARGLLASSTISKIETRPIISVLYWAELINIPLQHAWLTRCYAHLRER